MKIPDRTIDDIITGPLQIGSSQTLTGIGPVGTDERGPIVIATTAGIVCDGKCDPICTATGTAIRNLKVHAKNKQTGDGISITGIDPTHRSGEMLIERVLMYGGDIGNSDRGTFDRGIVVDGSMYRVFGAAGIRRVIMNGVRVADTRRDTILLLNAVHCCMNSVQIDTGVGSHPVMRIVDGQNIVGTNMIINGTLIIDGTAVDLHLSGRFDEVIVKSTVRQCVITGTVRKMVIERGATGAFIGCYREMENQQRALLNTFTVVGGKV